MDELLAPDEPRLAEQLDEHLDDVALYAEYRRLVAEQAAVRRVGTLVARGVEPSEVVGAVAEEMRRCVGAYHRRIVALRNKRRDDVWWPPPPILPRLPSGL